MVFCGLDIGTTNTKGVVLGRDGELLDCVSIACQWQTERGEAGAVSWYEHFCQVLEYFASKGHLADEEIFCSVTAQGGSFVLLDGDFQPVSRVYSWTERVSDSVVEDLNSRLDERWYYHTTGWNLGNWLAACKLRELAAEGLSGDVRFIASAPDFIYSQMTGKLITDVTNAQIMGMCEFEKAAWNSKILSEIGIGSEVLPAISSGLEILFDKVSSKWGRVSIVTGSHDQYAAMEAAGLEKDKGVMLGTGTAWVINGRTSEPLFDDRNFLIHPGRDLYRDQFGFIIGLGQIGRGCDKLLGRVVVDGKRLAGIESGFGKDEVPSGGIRIDMMEGTVDCEGGAETAIRRYMECVGSAVAFMLGELGLLENMDKIVMTGGAVSSRFWPQVVADLCDITVEAVDFPEFTAYGAALHARAAGLGCASEGHLPGWREARIYEPVNAAKYRQWYLAHQKPVLAEYILGK